MQTLFEEFWVSVSVPFKVIGLSTHKIQPQNAVQAKLQLIFNSFIGMAVSVIILLTYLNKPDIYDENINIIIDYLLLYAFLLTHLIIIIETIGSSSGQHLIYLKLLCATEIFYKKLNYIVKLHSLQVRCLKKIWLASLLSSVVICIVAATLDNFWEFFGKSVISIVVARLRFVQISIYVDILTEYFHSLAIVLQTIVDPNLDAYDKLRMLQTVKDVYGTLVDVNRLIESNFSWSMTAIIAQNFVDMLNQSYWIFINIYSIKSLSFGINITFFIVGFFIPLLHLVKSCYQCNRKSHKISSLMHNLSSERYSLRQAKLIYAISLNMLQQPIHIKIMESFTINYNLLAKMAGSIATYLTIVLQFQIREMKRD